MLQLISGPHLVVITDVRSAGRLQSHDGEAGHEIFLVTGIRSFPCATYQHKRQNLSQHQLEDESRYLALLDFFFSSTGIYFSATYDLTRSLQSQLADYNAGNGVSLDQVDAKYFLNRYLAEPFLRAHAENPLSLAGDFLAVCIEGCTVSRHESS